MSEPYPQIATWSIARGVLRATRAWVAGKAHETTVVWLGRRAQVAPVSAALLVRGVGVVEREGAFYASTEVFGALTRWARQRGLVLLADVHSHPPGYTGQLSDWDRTHGIRVPEFLAGVAGDGGRQPLERWGWYEFDRVQQRYRSIPPNDRPRRMTVAEARFVVGEVDASGVRVQ